MSFDSGCRNKIRYSSRRTARKALRTMQGVGKGRNGHMQAYQCIFCTFWHLGHLSPRVANGTVRKEDWVK